MIQPTEVIFSIVCKIGQKGAEGCFYGANGDYSIATDKYSYKSDNSETQETPVSDNINNLTALANSESHLVFLPRGFNAP